MSGSNQSAPHRSVFDEISTIVHHKVHNDIQLPLVSNAKHHGILQSKASFGSIV